MTTQSIFILFYTSFPVYLLRFLVVFALLVLCVRQILQGASPNLPFSLLLWVGMFEVFFYFKLARYVPPCLVSHNDGSNSSASLTLDALRGYGGHRESVPLIKYVLGLPQGRFILEKIGLLPHDVPGINLHRDDVLKKALLLAKQLNADYITTGDILVAYLLLIDQKTKVLFRRKVGEEDMVAILAWARYTFSSEEHKKPFTIAFSGEGIGESWVYGWTLETKKYARDVTAEVLQKEPMLLGREKEYKAILEALAHSEQKNVIVIGEAGSGRSTLVYYLAYQCYRGSVPPFLYHRRLYEILLVRLLAGAGNKGDLEARLEAVLTEIAHSGNLILFFPEFQNILGASTFALDLSGALSAYLQNGTIPVIGTMTPGNFSKFLEQSSFREMFHVIHLSESTQEMVCTILMRKSYAIEQQHGLSISYRAVVTAASLATRYHSDEALPGAAVRLLTDTASSVRLRGEQFVTDDAVIKKVEEETHVPLATPTHKEKELLLHLEERLHEKVVAQHEAVSVIAQAIRRVRTGMAATKKPLSFLFLGPTGVGKTVTAKALACVYFGGEENMIRLDMSEYAGDGSITRLLASSSHMGSEHPSFVDRVHDAPFSLILLDEFEKASLEVRNMFLQVLDEGRLTDSTERKISFLDAIIIATSNAGSEFIREEIERGRVVDAAFTQQLLSYLEVHTIFPPELLNRFDGLVVFRPLSQQESEAITRLILTELSKKLAEQDITVSFDRSVVEKIVREGIDKQFGARPLRRFVQNTIEDVIAREILEEKIQRGAHVLVRVDEANSVAITPQ